MAHCNSLVLRKLFFGSASSVMKPLKVQVPIAAKVDGPPCLSSKPPGVLTTLATDGLAVTHRKYGVPRGQNLQSGSQHVSHHVTNICATEGEDQSEDKGKKLHKCIHCSKGFMAERALLMHLDSHTGNRTYHCDYCSKSFMRKGHLVQHIYTHTGSRPYRCNDCSSSFARKWLLVEHTRVHTGERPFHCQLCPMAFARLTSLRRHVRVHKGEKPHQCDLCPKAFMDMHHLKRHKEKKHKGKTSA